MITNITQDGSTYILTMSEELGPARVERLLRYDGTGVWYLSEGYDYHHIIGRRKTWQKALHDALVLMEADVRRLQAS